jgi:hypothetical protein
MAVDVLLRSAAKAARGTSQASKRATNSTTAGPNTNSEGAEGQCARTELHKTNSRVWTIQPAG